MQLNARLILGEYSRTLDERYRLSLPPELVDSLFPADEEIGMLAKERAGCLSLWRRDIWQERIATGIELIRQKLAAHRLDAQVGRLQIFGRLLSTRFREVRIGDRGRFVIPEGFREFLQVEPGSDVLVIGAAVCIELWHPEAWRRYVRRRMPQFQQLFEELSA
ncbi:MAG: hypothetical protein RMJ19_01365 [Gemmatales bacterium]|nr:hypothetical protein [Gemmatales bacterium]MCS7159094.1 hypothetical protein [Gemmatales bacterium]MDW8174294.1 hypothetical protein [Gemmatales bacterium]MDW8222156.1 hypothetical protein [Gemmatales bacterium]